MPFGEEEYAFTFKAKPTQIDMKKDWVQTFEDIIDFPSVRINPTTTQYQIVYIQRGIKAGLKPDLKNWKDGNSNCTIYISQVTFYLYSIFIFVSNLVSWFLMSIIILMN